MQWHGVVATDLRGAIGKDGKLPWHLSSELKHFKQLTIHHPMVLGRKTFESFGKPLPDRPHLVLSNHAQKNFDDVKFFTSVSAIEDYCRQMQWQDIYVCGGAKIYQLLESKIDIWHMSVVSLEVEGADTLFPVQLKKNFLQQSSQHFVDEKTQIAWNYQLWRRQK